MDGYLVVRASLRPSELLAKESALTIIFLASAEGKTTSLKGGALQEVGKRRGIKYGDYVAALVCPCCKTWDPPRTF